MAFHPSISCVTHPSPPAPASTRPVEVAVREGGLLEKVPAGTVSRSRSCAACGSVSSQCTPLLGQHQPCQQSRPALLCFLARRRTCRRSRARWEIGNVSLYADREDLDHVAACKRLHRCGKAKGKKNSRSWCFVPGSAAGAAALKSGQGPPGRGIAVRQFSPLRRREGPPPQPPTTPPAKNYRVLRCFVLFAFFHLFRSLWLQMGQHAPTWTSRCANIAPKMGQPGPKMGQHSPKLGQHGPNVGQHSSKIGQHSPKMAPGWANWPPKWAHTASSRANIAPRWAQAGPT